VHAANEDGKKIMLSSMSAFPAYSTTGVIARSTFTIFATSLAIKQLVLPILFCGKQS
jgi:hypothetical protein